MILLLGGARSGKSAAAVRLAAESGLGVTFVATGVAGDPEMAARIRRHRAQRPPGWVTLEEPLELESAVASTDGEHFLVIDCLTLWVSTLMGAGVASEEVMGQAARVASLLRDRPAVVVSNEVGLGVVPMNELARTYRDVLGGVNAAFVAEASQTLLMVAGRALALSPVEALLNLT